MRKRVSSAMAVMVLAALSFVGTATLSLPTQDGPWDVTSITAAFGAGGHYTTSVAIAKPGQG